MSEYINVKGDFDNIIIDDSYRNIHLIDKKQILGSTAQIKKNNSGDGGNDYYPPLINTYGFIFTVNSLSKPIIACGNGAVYGIHAKDTGNSTWQITIYLHQYASVGSGNMETTVFDFYIFGTVDVYVRPVGIPVVEVFNKDGKLVYSSAMNPMRVVDYYSNDIRVDVPLFFDKNSSNPYKRPIPNYNPAKKYAIIQVTPAKDAWNWQAGGLITMYTSFCYVRDGFSYAQLYLTSFTTDVQTAMEVFVPGLSYIVIDVTGY